MHFSRHIPWFVLKMLLLIAAGAGAAECDDSIDNNSNGFPDMTDWYCKTPLDNDESSFRSGIPGDDANAPAALDCWFDSNSGSGDDGCSLHACCEIDGACPADLDPAAFNPAQCGVSQNCIDACRPLTKPGCDCFGCCEICAPGSGCANVFVNPVVSPACTIDVVDDPAKCRACVPNPSCQVPSHLFVDGFESAAASFQLLRRLPSLDSLNR